MPTRAERGVTVLHDPRATPSNDGSMAEIAVEYGYFLDSLIA